MSVGSKPLQHKEIQVQIPANSSAKIGEIQLGSMRKSGGGASGATGAGGSVSGASGGAGRILLNVFGLDAPDGNLVTPENPVYPDEFHALPEAKFGRVKIAKVQQFGPKRFGVDLQVFILIIISQI